MTKLFSQLWSDQRGAIISAELVLVMTVGVLAMVVGLSSVASSVNHELNDISNAIGTMNQSFWYNGMFSFNHAGVQGSGFIDARDACDCTVIVEVAPNTKVQQGVCGQLESSNRQMIGPALPGPHRHHHGGPGHHHHPYQHDAPKDHPMDKPMEQYEELPAPKGAQPEDVE